MSNPPLEKDPEVREHDPALPVDVRAPRWVRVASIIAIALIAIFVVVHLLGGGLGHHIPPS